MSANGQVLFAVREGSPPWGVVRSPNGGETWQKPKLGRSGLGGLVVTDERDRFYGIQGNYVYSSLQSTVTTLKPED